MTDTDNANVQGQTDTDVTPEANPFQPAAIVKLWAYRRILLIAVVVGVALTGVVYFAAETEHLATLRFRLMFEGADSGTYPSGVRFTTEDIKARSVLDQVYKANKLDRHGSFEDFQMAFYVAAKPSTEMEALESNFNSQLANRKLTAVERTTLEQEYMEKRSGLLNGIDYELAMDLSLGFSTLPTELQEKVIRDVLSTWAHEATDRKGALKYQMTVLSENLLPEDILSEDYFITADMLRLKTGEVLRNIVELKTLPGAMSYRSDADKKMTLGEIEANLNDMLRFKLSPTMYMVRTFGLSKKPELASMYIQSAVYNTTLLQKQSADRVKVIQDALTNYMLQRGMGTGTPTTGARNGTTGAAPLSSVPAMIPQFGDSFLDRLIEMASASEDIKFKQDYTERITTEALAGVQFDRELKFYQDMLKATLGEDKESNEVLTPARRAVIEDIVKKHLEEARDEVKDQTSQLGPIYEQLSKKNLNPPTELYSAPEPVVSKKVRAISLAKLATYLVGIVGGLVFLASAGCLYHARIRSLGKKAAA